MVSAEVIEYARRIARPISILSDCSVTDDNAEGNEMSAVDTRFLRGPYPSPSGEIVQLVRVSNEGIGTVQWM